MQKPYASDWQPIPGTSLEYSAETGRYWCRDRQKYYDHISATHNGLIGAGAQLKKTIKAQTTGERA